MKVLVVYDVSEDSRRLKLAGELKWYGLSRIQRSAFQGDLDSQRFKNLIRRAREIVDVRTDVVHVVPLGLREWEGRIVLGKEGYREALV